MQRILIVDDDKSIRYSLRRIFEEHYLVMTAQNGEEAISLFQQNLPDLIIMDIRMPGQNGIDLLKEMRAKDPKSLVIVMTA